MGFWQKFRAQQLACGAVHWVLVRSRQGRPCCSPRVCQHWLSFQRQGWACRDLPHLRAWLGACRVVLGCSQVSFCVCVCRYIGLGFPTNLAGIPRLSLSLSLSLSQHCDVKDFRTSWSDGMAFCAILHSFLPDKIPYDDLSPADPEKNFTLAFGVAK